MRCIPALGQAMMITSLFSTKFGKQMNFQCCRPCSNFDAKVWRRPQQHLLGKFFFGKGGGIRKKRIWRDPFSHIEIGHWYFPRGGLYGLPVSSSAIQILNGAAASLPPRRCAQYQAPLAWDNVFGAPLEEHCWSRLPCPGRWHLFCQ